MDMFKETVRRMAHYKMNHMILYLEDAFQLPSHPDIGEDRDQITAQQARELCAYAKKHHVDVAPCYNSPAHMGHTLRHPNYQYLQEDYSCLCPWPPKPSLPVENSLLSFVPVFNFIHYLLYFLISIFAIQ